MRRRSVSHGWGTDGHGWEAWPFRDVRQAGASRLCVCRSFGVYVSSEFMAKKGTAKKEAGDALRAARPSSLLDTRVIYCGDNLEQLAKLPDHCIDLIYIDPPFNSNRNYEASRARRRRSVPSRTATPARRPTSTTCVRTNAISHQGPHRYELLLSGLCVRRSEGSDETANLSGGVAGRRRSGILGQA